LLSGDLGPYLNRLLARKLNWSVATLKNGAEVAAKKILELFDRS
jgi:hypothetical protein